MNDRAITGVLALCPGRAAAATLEQVLEQPDLANDPVVIVGDSSRQRDKRATYRAIFSTLGRVRRPVLWVPECTEFAFEREATTRLPIRAGPDELVGELMRTFRPCLAPRFQRPAVYAVRNQGSREWLEL
ncbi:MAG TPA: hypothetical protein VFD90_15035 [Gaiellales bacterium]|nr:hypothetical protein [Gaiellales bacterium]